MACMAVSSNHIVSSLLCLKDWQPVPSLQQKVACRVDQWKGTVGRRAESASFRHEQQFGESDAVQRIPSCDAVPSTRRGLLLGAAAMLGNTGERCDLATGRSLES